MRLVTPSFPQALVGLTAVLLLAPMTFAAAVPTAGGGTDPACGIPGRLVNADREARAACSADVAPEDKEPFQAGATGFPAGWTIGGALVLMGGLGATLILVRRRSDARLA